MTFLELLWKQKGKAKCILKCFMIIIECSLEYGKNRRDLKVWPNAFVGGTTNPPSNNNSFSSPV